MLDLTPESPFPILSLTLIEYISRLMTSVCKRSDRPELTTQIDLKTIHGNPHSALKICIDGSMGNGGISGSGVHIETPDDLAFRDIWILTHNHASIHHLSRRTTVGDMTSLNILDIVVRFLSRHSVYFQWVPSRIGLSGNEIADNLDKSATADTLLDDTCITFAGLSCIKNSMRFGEFLLLALSILGKNSLVCHQLNIPRDQQTTLLRFFSGHNKSLNFQQGQKVFPECHRGEAYQV
ncbi:autophagy protein 5 [Trichonephila clavipes]|nr:autophagy protein 5 [Trichonephila clavipes]